MQKISLSLDQEGMASYLQQHIQTDPPALAPHINANRVLMVMANFDKAAPYESQLALNKAMGNTETITIPTGRPNAAAYLFYLRYKVRKFFDRKFGEALAKSAMAPTATGGCSDTPPKYR